ncbi:MAG: hypothetical protein C4567_13705 [Deltaproteobacteria bacterium]|nr:MAG: hypothetical protein C4567_13705 [Deltaproteobacteria bacterium]
MIRRSEFAFFEIFQDPVFTIIALILLATTPMIFPAEPKNVDPRAPALIDEVNSLNQEIHGMKSRQQELRQEVDNRQAESDQMEARRQQAEAKRAQDAQSEKQQQDLQTQLQRELEAKKREVEKLRGELGRVEVKGPVPGKFTPIKDSSKNIVWVQLTGNKLFPVDDAHYTAKIFRDVSGGNIVRKATLERKANAAGEPLEDLDRPDGKFQNLIKKLNSQKERVMLLVNKNSFPIFRKARSILDRQDIEYGWWPYNNNDITLTMGGGGGHRPPSTSR